MPSSPLRLPDLYEGFENAARSLPLPIFAAVMDSSASALRVDSQISLCQGVLATLMPGAALSPARVDRAAHDAGGVSPAILERCFLPYPANTIDPADNAKVSLLAENLVQVVLRDGSVVFGPGFRAAVEKGIQARAAKVKRKAPGGGGGGGGRSGRGRGVGGGPGGEDDAEARLVLEMSGERLRVLADLVEGVTGDDEDDVPEGDGMDVEEG